MSDPQVKPSKSGFLLVEFRHGLSDPGGPYYQRYTDWTGPVLDPATGAKWTPAPEMRVEIAPNSGLLDEGPTRIETKILDEFTDQITSGEPHALCEVRIWEEWRTLDIERRLRWLGGLASYTRNKGGVSGAIELECLTFKQLQLNKSMGIVASADCQWTFGDKNCKREVEIHPGVIVAMNGKTLRISGLPPKRDFFFHRGFIEFKGLRLLIRTHKNGEFFQMAREAPVRWLGQEVRVFAGCPKKIWACRAWNQESEFGGLGFAMPSYHPAFEQPN